MPVTPGVLQHGDPAVGQRLVDLSAIVSRDIGETEKNLARVFDAAARSDPILSFDEAEAR